MAVKTDTEVIIGGSVLTLSGYESEEYLQKVASYINNKLSEYAKVEGFRRQPVDKQHILLEINIADDYFKAKERIASLEDDVAAKEKELYNVTHDLVATQIKLENTNQALKNAQQELQDNSRKIVRLETEMRNTKRKEKE